MSTSLDKCHSIADLRSLAQGRLPKVMFDYIDGAADDEVTLARNSSGFNRWQFMPRALVDATDVKLATVVQGSTIALPVVFAPTGGTRLFHHRGEFATSAAAAEAGTIFSLSSMASIDIETIAAHTAGDKWFQIYVWKDRGVVREFIHRCKASGYKALCLTVDVACPGYRERDLRNGFTLPPRFTAASLFDMALHPRWWMRMLTTPRVTLANVAGKAGIGVTSATTLGQYANSQLDQSVTWKDMEWMADEWDGPFLVKGILSAQDARIAIDCGATGVILSNHGGRQLDHSAAPIDVLPEVAEAVGGRTEIIVDGGVRRGTDVVKALALGANACMIGRPYLYGLAAGGEAGAAKAIALLRDEIRRALILLGCPDVRKLDRSFLRRIDSLPTAG